jgi:hypothetical protein
VHPDFRFIITYRTPQNDSVPACSDKHRNLTGFIQQAVLQTANNETFYFEIAAGLWQSTYLSRLLPFTTNWRWVRRAHHGAYDAPYHTLPVSQLIYFLKTLT